MKTLLLFFVSFSALASPISSWNFDWDDNVFFMPTRIYLYEKGTNRERAVSTTEFAVLREHLGNYEIRPTSFREFEGDLFVEHVMIAVETQSESKWQAPAFRAFQQALSDPATAAWTTIITARGHDAEQMMRGLEYLQAKGYIKHLPPQENLFGVGHPRFKATAASPSAAKTVVMKTFLDRLQALAGPGNCTFLWGFSDDDYGNYEKAVTELSKDIRRWPNVKITLLFTGINHPREKAREEVLQPDGRLRPRRADEVDEKPFCPTRSSASASYARP